MEIDRGELRSAAEAYDLERHDLAETVRQAAADLSAIGDFWGTGKLAVTFFKGEDGDRGYEAHTDQIMKGIAHLDEAHQAIPDRLRLMGDNVQVVNWNTIADLLAKLPEPGEDPQVWGEPPSPGQS